MRRDRAFKRGPWLSLLFAGVVGYLIGDWHAVATQSLALSASQNIALRFPEAAADPVAANGGSEAAPAAASAAVLGDHDLALLNPERMVPASHPPLPQAAAPAPAAKPASAAEAVVSAPAPRPVAAARPKTELRSEVKSALKAAANVVRGSRPGFMLNDAQIASIKQRLHLSEDQERMWPAVEAALRNIAYARAHDQRNHAGTTDVASLDPESAEVQGLKSAAVPLIMSFNDEQKNEVKSLAHVMGLDRLAQEF
jgi:hypothetical protein